MIILSKEQIQHMVDRFLGWKLPEDFSPDAGISFKAEFNENTDHPMKHEPVGTNLFTAMQAEEMLRFMLGDTEQEEKKPKGGFIATKKPIDIEYVPFERKFHEIILSWATPERPIEIATPRCIDGKAIATITTLEGTHTATEGEDYIIRGVKGEVYPCKKDIFEATYEK